VNPASDPHHSSWVMLALLVGFAVIHSGGASLRYWGVERIGERAWRLLFAAVSIPSAVVVIGYFLAHRYDGLRLWNLQDQPWIVPVVWTGTAISFLFLYPATYNLLEIPAVLKPQVRMYATGIIRVSRHPQAIGQILWCCTHLLWIGSSFMVATCIGLIGHLERRSPPGQPLRRSLPGAEGEHLRDPVPCCARRPPATPAQRIPAAGPAGHCHRCGGVLVGPSLHRQRCHRLRPNRTRPLAGIRAR
jgi:uncharacterized membrane protein